jgi:hypothetical protein
MRQIDLGIAIQVATVMTALQSVVAEIVDVSPTVTNVPRATQHSPSGRILSLAVSADPAPGCYIPGTRCTVGTPPGAPIARLYAGTFAGCGALTMQGGLGAIKRISIDGIGSYDS